MLSQIPRVGGATAKPWVTKGHGGTKVQSGRIKRIEAFELVLRMKPSPFKLHLDFTKNRQACESLVTEVIVRDQRMYKVEARIFFMR